MLGLPSGIVRLVPYDPAWPLLFDGEKASIQRALGASCLRVEHIGSTAVDGMVSKPVLDIAVEMSARVDLSAVVPALSALGYVHKGEFGLPGREFFVKGEPVTHHVHVVGRGSPHLDAWLAFRARLRTDAQARVDYLALKRRLAAEHPASREAYTAGKRSFIESLL